MPPQLVFSSTGTKDSLTIIRESGVFAVNLVAEAAWAAMNRTSASVAPDVDEFEFAGIPRAECSTIAAPRVADAPATLECRVVQVIPLLGRDNWLVHGEVTGVHLRDAWLVGGRFDVPRFNPVARLGYRDFSVVREVVELARPGED